MALPTYDELTASPTPAATGDGTTAFQTPSGLPSYESLTAPPPPSPTPETDKVSAAILGLAEAGAEFPTGAELTEAAQRPDTGAGPWPAIKETAIGMIKPPTNEEILVRALDPTGMGLGDRIMNMYRAGKALTEGKSREEAARQLSPEYAMIEGALSNPVGSQEWWRSVVPLGVEAAQFLPILKGIKGLGEIRPPEIPPELLKPTEVKPPTTIETKLGGETDAKQSSYAQVQEGAAPLGQQERPSGERPQPGDSDYAVRETQGGATGGQVPPEPVPARESVAATPPESAHAPEYVEPPVSEQLRGPPPAVATPEEGLGPGAASREEYMRRYALVGASKLLEGHTELGQFSLEMSKEFGQGIADLLPEVFERSKKVVNEFQTATGRSDVTREINRQIGVTKATETPVMVRPFTAYKAALRDAQKAGSAGYSRGLREARAEAKTAMEQFKGDIAQADKFMAGDQDQVRKNLVEYVKATLPPSERGAFINRIAQALRRPSIFRSEDVGRMYKRAFDVMQDMDQRAEQVYRDRLIDDIKTVSKRATASPSVDLDAKRIMQRLLSDVNLRDMSKATQASLEKTRDFLNRQRGLGKDVFMPEKVLSDIERLGKRSAKDLPTAVLENLHNNLSLAERLGRFKFKNRQQVWNTEKAARLGDILKGPGTPMELRPQFRPQPGESLTTEQKMHNWMATFGNRATAFDLGHLPEDVIFDMAGNGHGTYAGPLFDHIRTPVDASYDAAEHLALSEINPLREIIDKHKLGDRDEDVIGLWAALQQEGGEARALETANQETINTLKAKGLTPGQKEAYDYMRKTLDNALPDIQNIMHELFNIQVVPEKNYFPWMREYDVFRPTKEVITDARTGQQIQESDLHNFGKIVGDFFRRNTSQVPRGFTLERLPGAEGPIRMDSFGVFERHMRNSARLREMQRALKMSGEMIRDPKFMEKQGRFMQGMMNDWLTATATDGAGSNVYRWPLIDMFRRGANRSLVFFRLTSNIKHASAIPQGVINSGGFDWYWQGLHHQFSPEGVKFLEKFPQIMQRQAGDVSLQELQDTMNRMAPMRLADRWGFVLGKELDARNSRAVFIGRYLKNLKDAELEPNLENPVNQKAAYNAMAFMRRTVSSTLAKDIQPVLGRGMGYGGNVTVARMMNAFRQYALERWSLMRYDMPEAFKSGNYLRGLSLLGAVGAASVYEVSVPLAVKKGWNMLFHVPENHKHDESMFMRISKDLFSMGPYTNNLLALYEWGETGTPLVDIGLSLGKSVHTLSTAKRPETRQRAMMRAGFTAAELAGMPGAGFAESVVMPKLFPPPEKVGRRRRMQ